MGHSVHYLCTLLYCTVLIKRYTLHHLFSFSRGEMVLGGKLEHKESTGITIIKTKKCTNAQSCWKTLIQRKFLCNQFNIRTSSVFLSPCFCNKSDYNMYKLFGYDIMLDDHLQPHLIEINSRYTAASAAWALQNNFLRSVSLGSCDVSSSYQVSKSIESNVFGIIFKLKTRAFFPVC